MPNQPKTPIRTVRVGASLWEAVQRKAASEGRTVSEIVREALERYVAS
jgi:predicted DNA binding CopG/RHH family protein